MFQFREITATAVKIQHTGQIERAESAVKGLGFRQVRVRHHGDVARVEVEPADVERLFAQREAVVKSLKGAGYTFVALDLEGYATGKLNEAWKPRAAD